ncbi:MAG: terminase large subunit [Planctomycetota bacterium]|nr:terminase large subunit [Planctomycetota bacterium]
MATATAKPGRPRGKRRTLAPKKWRGVLCAIPGYDPFRDAEDCWFDPEAAEHYIGFIETCCTHIEGALAGQRFILETWERAIVANLFGWYRRDFLDRVVRRYRKAFVFVPRKNGKTPLAAAIHNAVFFLDPEAGQINNIAAASRDQASKLYRHIVGMVNNEPEMAKRCHQYATTRCLTKPDNTVTKVIPADENVAHGDNQHLGIIDELHAQPNRKLYDALVTAMASANRIQPLMLFVTTADYDRPSICNEEYHYAVKVRDGIIDDPAYLPVIYEADRVDDWTRQDVWEKANPNLGVSVSLDYLRGESKKARENPAYENTFKRLHLNIRTEQAERCIPMEAWDACRAEIDWQAYAGKACWAALDIGALSDFVSLVLAFGEDVGEPVTVDYEDLRGEQKQWAFVRRDYTVRHFCWLPDRPPTRDPRMESQIAAWTKAGHILRTPGNVVDYDRVGADLARIIQPYAVQQIAIDQGFQGMQITQDLMRRFGEERVVAFRQGILSMAAPFRELMQLLMSERLHHDGDPVLRWMASNVAAETRGGLTKPSKDKSSEKIDGITAATMAIGIAMTAAPPAQSVYESRGIRTI